MLTVLSGLGLMFSLIIAVGAQNVFVLRQGLRREHVLTVVLICTTADALLVLTGTAGLGFLIGRLPWLLIAARWLGAISLIVYGVVAARRAWRSGAETLVADASSGEDAAPAGASRRADAEIAPDTDIAPDAEARPRGGSTATLTRSRHTTVVLAALAFTYLNPNVYLDTVLLIGSIAATHGEARWLFATGAILASITWFFALGFGARHLGRWLRTPRAWRILDTGIAVLLVVMGVLLVLPVLPA